MAMLTLQNASVPEVTLLSNTFIDFYMPEANGEFVKVYIYLLRSLSQAPVSFSLAQMADRLLCTERDILRALKYWAKQGLLSLDFTDNNYVALHFWHRLSLLRHRKLPLPHRNSLQMEITSPHPSPLHQNV